MGVLKKLVGVENDEHIADNKAVFIQLYFKKNMTARKVAENQNIEFSPSFAKALVRVLGTKGMGLGGARLGAGNKGNILHKVKIVAVETDEQLKAAQAAIAPFLNKRSKLTALEETYLADVTALIAAYESHRFPLPFTPSVFGSV